MLWQHDHALALYPLPHLLVLADGGAPLAATSFEDCECLNPVRAAILGHRLSHVDDFWHTACGGTLVYRPLYFNLLHLPDRTWHVRCRAPSQAMALSRRMCHRRARCRSAMCQTRREPRSQTLLKSYTIEFWPYQFLFGFAIAP